MNADDTKQREIDLLNIRRHLNDESNSDPNIQLLQPSITDLNVHGSHNDDYQPRSSRRHLKDELHLFDGKNTPQNISTYGFLLGMLCSGGFMFALTTSSAIPQFGLFLAFLALFHFLEYLATALFNADKLSLDSYLINHSAHYHAAHAVALIEFLIEYYFLPQYKSVSWINYVGLGLVVLGQGCRTIAMFSARHNFSHHIVDYKAKDHVLVQHGIYSLMRHPSYFGFYWWAIGVQVLLMNPICFALFIYWLHKFFSERIEYEEHTLQRFFGQEWVLYRSKTPTLMPFIS